MSPPPSPHFRKTTRLNESGRSIAVTLTHSLAPCLFELRASVTLLIFAAFSEERTRNKWGVASELMTWAGSGSGRPSYVRRVLSRVGMHDAVFLKVDQDQRCVRAVLLLETITHVFFPAHFAVAVKREDCIRNCICLSYASLIILIKFNCKVGFVSLLVSAVLLQQLYAFGRK